jgi:hypothetical protein
VKIRKPFEEDDDEPSSRDDGRQVVTRIVRRVR